MKMSFSALLLAVLIVGAGAGIAFGGGVIYGRDNAPKARAAATTAAAALPAGVDPSALAALRGGAGGTPGAGGTAGGGARGGGGAGGAGGAGGFGGTAGAVDSISGTTLTVRTQQGTLQTVTLQPDTRVLSTTQGSVADLKPGTPITVLGQPDAAGVINATAITMQQTTSPLPPIGTPGARPASTAPQAAGTPGAGWSGRRRCPGWRRSRWCASSTDALGRPLAAPGRASFHRCGPGLPATSLSAPLIEPTAWVSLPARAAAGRSSALR